MMDDMGSDVGSADSVGFLLQKDVKLEIICDFGCEIIGDFIKSDGTEK